MSKYQSKHRGPYTPRHRAPEPETRRPIRSSGLPNAALLGMAIMAGSTVAHQAGHETYSVAEDTCYIVSVTDTGEMHEQILPDGTKITVDKVVIEPYLDLTPQTERRFRQEGDEHEVRARQVLPGGTELGIVEGFSELNDTGKLEVVLEPSADSREYALMEFAVGGVPCADGLVFENDKWRFAGPIDQYESRLQQGIQQAP